MINLLPPEIKSSYRYAARNVSLLRWVIACGLSLIGIGIIGSFGWLAVHQSMHNTSRQAATTQMALSKAHVTQLNTQAASISSSFKLVEKVLGQEILFSKLLKQMATAMPTGARLTALNIAQITGGSGLDVSAQATNYTTATQVQVNLADPNNQIFAKADIESVVCDAKGASDASYPCTITLRAQFGPNNPFLFINQQQAKS